MKTNYHLRISVKNSRGNELVKIFNFTCEDPVFDSVARQKLHLSIKSAQRYNILRKLVKENYSMKLEDGFKHPVKNPPLSFEGLCLKVCEFRFEEVVSKKKYDYIYTKHSVNIGHYFHILDCWNSEYEGADFTFFELSDETQLGPAISFDELGEALKHHGITLYRSKRYGLWFVVYKFELSKNTEDWSLIFTKRSDKKVCIPRRVVTL